MRNRDFPHRQFKYEVAFKNKEKRRVFKYISVFREKYRYEVLRYVGCILSALKNGLITRFNKLKVWAFLMLFGNEFHILGP